MSIRFIYNGFLLYSYKFRLALFLSNAREMIMRIVLIILFVTVVIYKTSGNERKYLSWKKITVPVSFSFTFSGKLDMNFTEFSSEYPLETIKNFDAIERHLKKIQILLERHITGFDQELYKKLPPRNNSKSNVVRKMYQLTKNKHKPIKFRVILSRTARKNRKAVRERLDKEDFENHF